MTLNKSLAQSLAASEESTRERGIKEAFVLVKQVMDYHEYLKI